MPPLNVIVLILALAVVTPVSARMYEWVSPATGRVQLSGTPPTWYRSNIPGPRVRVFENGALVDDTAIALKPEENRALREVATAKVEERRQLEALRQLEIANRREAAIQAARAREEELRVSQAQKRLQRAAETAAAEPPASEGEKTAEAKSPDVPAALDAKTIERLKALVSEFDRTGTIQ